jgi:cysteine-rich repeat protein
VLRDADAVPADAQTRDCLTAVARAVEQTLRLTARAQRAPLDRIAAQALTPSEKDRWITQARAGIAARHPMLAARIAGGCRGRPFSDLYGRSVDAFASDIAARAECLAGAVYVQGAVVCPPPRCGNGMQEPREECDDGNADDSDWCRSDCRRAQGESSVVGRQSAVLPSHPDRRPTSND